MYFFFFSCSGHHRDLHSFPTRRSSDLSRSRRSRRASARSCAAPREGAIRNRRTRSGGPPCSACPRDRKSTRLNSSHLGISYAVFCLKKKKKTLSELPSREQQRQQRRTP